MLHLTEELGIVDHLHIIRNRLLTQSSRKKEVPISRETNFSFRACQELLEKNHTKFQVRTVLYVNWKDLFLTNHGAKIDIHWIFSAVPRCKRRFFQVKMSADRNLVGSLQSSAKDMT